MKWPWQKTVAVRPPATWASIWLGHHKEGANYRSVLLANGYQIGPRANEMLDRIYYFPLPVRIELVRFSAGMLGLEGIQFGELCKRLVDAGFDLCPPEVAPALRLSLTKQSEGEWLRIVMKPITLADNTSDYFTIISESDGLWLGGSHREPDAIVASDDHFVCLRR